MKDLIIGCINNYYPEQIKVWVNSINHCGFVGDKVIISFGVPQETILYLIDNGFMVFESSLHPSEYIHNRRFLDIWNYLESNESYRYVIATDVRDVLFQTDPTIWLKNNLKKSILASSESIKIKDEEWNNRNVFSNYPHIHPYVNEGAACNVGTLAGTGDEFKHFCLQLYHFIITKSPSIETYADQAAFNCFVHMKHFKEVIQFVSSEEGWCCQLGTTLDPRVKDIYAPILLEPVPVIDNDIVKTNKGNLFALVHQYDRVPELKNILENKYK
jgi:hypothetical protein